MTRRATPFISIMPNELKTWLHDGAEIALIDVREAGEFGESHLFYAVNVPYSRLEKDVVRLVPNPNVRLVIVDEDGGHLAKIAATRLSTLGYSQVHTLEGGNKVWKASGKALYAGVNVPSKAFGELAEHFFETPRITATALRQKQLAGENVLVLDGRPFNEYQKMNIPGAFCCPNGELALRVTELAKDENTTIVINCAGRTRSIIGAQTLRNLGLPNPVYALENGTQGWFLADLKLEHGSMRRLNEKLPVESLAASRQRAQQLATRYDVKTIDHLTLAQWWRDETKTTFLCDVRSPEEYLTGHLSGAASTPGGQLIQATDQYVAVRGARLVLWDGDGVRAPVIAHWLSQMGWCVTVLDHRTKPSDMPMPPTTVRSVVCETAPIKPDELQTFCQESVAIVDIRISANYRQRHLKNAQWCSRRNLTQLLINRAKAVPIVLISDDEVEAQLAVNDLKAAGFLSVRYFADFSAQAEVLGLDCVSTPNLPPDSERIDYLFFVHDRHDGNKAAAEQYLAWETNLLSQLDDLEIGSYHLAKHA
jgi:rhodanese-related sulfurtransferase